MICISLQPVVAACWFVQVDCAFGAVGGPLYVQISAGNSQLKVRAEAIAQRFSAGLTPLTRLRVPPQPSSGSEVVVDVDMIDLQVVIELSGLEILDDDALPQRVRL